MITLLIANDDDQLIANDDDQVIANDDDQVITNDDERIHHGYCDDEELNDDQRVDVLARKKN